MDQPVQNRDIQQDDSRAAKTSPAAARWGAAARKAAINNIASRGEFRSICR